MEIDAFFIADHVATADGKFYVQGGGFTRCEVPGLPAPISLGVLARIRLEPDEVRDQHRLRFTLIGPTGVPNVEPIEGITSLAVEGSMEPLKGEQTFIQVGVQIPAMAVREGLYHVELAVDGGDVLRRIPLPIVVRDVAEEDVDRTDA